MKQTKVDTIAIKMGLIALAHLPRFIRRLSLHSLSDAEVPLLPRTLVSCVIKFGEGSSEKSNEHWPRCLRQLTIYNYASYRSPPKIAYANLPPMLYEVFICSDKKSNAALAVGPNLNDQLRKLHESLVEEGQTEE